MSKKPTGRTLISFDWVIKHLLRDKADFGILEGFNKLSPPRHSHGDYSTSHTESFSIIFDGIM
jgi:hypothetical protein